MIKPLPKIMGIVNVTPDSFSDGGQFFDPARAIAHAIQLINNGAQIIDIGGESTRPGAASVSVDEEIARVVPVIKALKNSGAVISIDTRNAATMQAAIDAGATMINDVTALTHDPESIQVVARANLPVCLMHMQGDPQSMQKNPFYNNVVEDVLQFLIQSASRAVKAGLAVENIILDPGIGFGKTLEHNLDLLRHLERFTATPYKILLGASRKSFIEKIMKNQTPADQRLPGSIAAALRGAEAGVAILRVHDVAETKQALEAWAAIRSA